MVSVTLSKERRKETFLLFLLSSILCTSLKTMQIYSITLTKPNQTNRIKKTSSKAIASHFNFTKEIETLAPWSLLKTLWKAKGKLLNIKWCRRNKSTPWAQLCLHMHSEAALQKSHLLHIQISSTVSHIYNGAINANDIKWYMETELYFSNRMSKLLWICEISLLSICFKDFYFHECRISMNYQHFQWGFLFRKTE